MLQITDWRGTVIQPGDIVLFAEPAGRKRSMAEALVEDVDSEDGSIRVYVLARSLPYYWNTEEIIRFRVADNPSVTVISGFPSSPDGL